MSSFTKYLNVLPVFTCASHFGSFCSNCLSADILIPSLGIILYSLVDPIVVKKYKVFSCIVKNNNID